MKHILPINEGWAFVKGCETAPAAIPAGAPRVALPHCWNALDGQDGGSDYWRGPCCYLKTIEKPAGKNVYVEVEAASSVGNLILWATTQQPFLMGILVSVIVGVALTLPISSAAICAALGLTGLAGGAAVAGCCAQMIGFAVISFRDNGWGGFFAQGIGTSMLQVPNIIKNPRIWLAPTLASAVTGPIATCIFGMQMNGAPISSGMGTCGLVGQIGVYTGWLNDITAGAKTAVTAMDWLGLVLICFVLPAVLSFVFDLIFRKIGWVKDGDMKIDA